MDEATYTQSEVIQILANLLNGIGLYAKGDIMPKRYKESVEINGEKRWITGKSLSDLLEGYLRLCLDAGVVLPGIGEKPQATPVLFGPYLQSFVETYKSNQEALTVVNRKRIINNHILPKWGHRSIDSIKAIELQQWFNELSDKGYSHETLMKIKNTMSPALDAAVEEDILKRNPLKSSLLIIGGSQTKSHKAIPHDKMDAIKEALNDISDVRERAFAGLLCYTGMRLEEVLGLKWEDIDFENGWIYIQRAVIHPDRNKPEVKDPKTKTSKRRIPLAEPLKRLLVSRYLTGFVVYSYSDKSRNTPLSYTEARRIFAKIRDRFDLEGYSAHDFRDTCATEWREKGVPLDVISSLLGHSKVDVTQNRYVKYRDDIFQGVRDIMDVSNRTEKEQIC